MNDTNYGYITPENLTLFTDLSELTMIQGYYNQKHNPRATFDLFFRNLPPDRGYLQQGENPVVVGRSPTA